MNYQKIIAWFAGDDTGPSSKHMAAVAAGVRGNGYHPLDPSDRLQIGGAVLFGLARELA